MTSNFTGGDDWIPPGDEWSYVVEYVAPPVPWWRSRDIVMGGTAAVFLVVATIVAVTTVLGPAASLEE